MTGDLPIYIHTLVLGADVGVAQRDCATGEYSGHRTRETAVTITPFDGSDPRQRRYLAAWARRNLFGGASTVRRDE